MAVSMMREDVCVTGSQSKLDNESCRTNWWIKLGSNQTISFPLGFPLHVDVSVKRCSASLTSLPSTLDSIFATDSCIVDYQTRRVFWIPYDDIFSDVAGDIISKIIYLMHVPFSLNHKKLKWTGISYQNVETSTAMLENHHHHPETLISNIVEFARSMKNCPSLPSHRWCMTLDISKVTYLPQLEFKETRHNLHKTHNVVAWENAQAALDSQIDRFQTFEQGVWMKKMEFPASSNSLDMCLICREDFLPGSMVSCINRCSHVYHEACLLEWIFRNPSCPYCRSELSKEV